MQSGKLKSFKAFYLSFHERKIGLQINLQIGFQIRGDFTYDIEDFENLISRKSFMECPFKRFETGFKKVEKKKICKKNSITNFE